MDMDLHRFVHETLRRADEFHSAFRQIDPKRPTGISWPRYFLLCHAIELALKAFLRFKGMSEKDLKAPCRRHRLKRLMEEALQAGLAIDPSIGDEFKLLDEAHAKFWARYAYESGVPVFVIDPFEPKVGALLREVSKAVRLDHSSQRVI